QGIGNPALLAGLQAGVLLHEDGDATLPPDPHGEIDPGGIHRAVARPALPAHEDPVKERAADIALTDPWGEIHEGQGRLVADPARARILHPEQFVNSPCVVRALDRDASPDIWERRDLAREEAPVPGRPLRQEQPIERLRVGNREPQALAGLLQLSADRVGSLLQNIRHRGAEDPAPFAGRPGFPVPAEGIFPVRIPEEPSGDGLAPDGVAGEGRPHPRIAAVARGGDLHTAPPRVERVVAPPNAGLLAHQTGSLSWGRDTGGSCLSLP